MGSQTWRLISLFILVFEGFGIRMLDGVIPSPISFWTALLFVINIKTIIKMPIKAWLVIMGIIVFYLVFSLLKGTNPRMFLFAGWLSAFFVLSNYYNGQNNFVDDLYKFTRFCVFYSLLHLPVLIIAKDALTDVDYGLSMKTFLHLFYYGNHQSVFGLYRPTGFCWEPSCWNCLLNINLALSLVLNKHKEIIYCIIAIVLVFSTTGLMAMVVAISTYFVLFLHKRSLKMVFLIGILMTMAAPIAFENLNNKLESGSGATRYGDFFVAEYVIRTNPFLGGDLDHITSNVEAMNAKVNNWGFSANAINIYEQVGMTNAFAALFVEWGLFVTLSIFLLMFKSPLFAEKKWAILLSITLLVVLMGTPIARTGFFYLFSISSLLLRRKPPKFYERKFVLQKRC